MALTLESVVTELDGAGPAARHGRGLQGHRPTARSWGPGATPGVILSQLLRGLADAVARAPTGPAAPTWPRPWSRPAMLAYQAVVRPVEGTILTVARAAGDGAEHGGRRRGRPASDVLEAARAAAADALARTPELLAGAGPGRRGRRRGHRLRAAARRAPRTSSTAGRCPRPAAEVRRGRSAVAQRLADGRRRGRRRRPALRGHVLARGARRHHRRRSRRCGPASATRSSSSAATACGTATSTPTTSARPSRPRIDAGRPREHPGHRPGRAGRGGALGPRGPAPDEHRPTARRPGDAPPWWPWSPGTGIGRIFRSLGVHRLVAGGQSMNPSTAADPRGGRGGWPSDAGGRPARTTRTSVPVAEQVDELDRPSRCGWCPPAAIVEGFAALLAYDPEAGRRRRTPRPWPSRPRRVVAGEVTRAVRDADRATPGRSTRATGSGSSRDGIVRRSADIVLGGHLRSARRAAHRRARARHGHRGRGVDGRPTPGASPSGWTSTAPTWPSRSTTGASRSTRTSSASSDPRRPSVPASDSAARTGRSSPIWPSCR